MDPYACLRAVASAIEANDTDAAIQGMRDYHGWRSKGGFGESRDEYHPRLDQWYYTLWRLMILRDINYKED